MICSVCELEKADMVDEFICVDCLQDLPYESDEIRCSDYDYFLPDELDPTPEELFQDSPEDRLAD